MWRTSRENRTKAQHSDRKVGWWVSKLPDSLVLSKKSGTSKTKTTTFGRPHWVTGSPKRRILTKEKGAWDDSPRRVSHTHSLYVTVSYV